MKNMDLVDLLLRRNKSVFQKRYPVSASRLANAMLELGYSNGNVYAVAMTALREFMHEKGLSFGDEERFELDESDYRELLARGMDTTASDSMSLGSLWSTLKPKDQEAILKTVEDSQKSIGTIGAGYPITFAGKGQDGVYYFITACHVVEAIQGEKFLPFEERIREKDDRRRDVIRVFLPPEIRNVYHQIEIALPNDTTVTGEVVSYGGVSSGDYLNLLYPEDGLTDWDSLPGYDLDYAIIRVHDIEKVEQAGMKPIDPSWSASGLSFVPSTYWSETTLGQSLVGRESWMEYVLELPHFFDVDLWVVNGYSGSPVIAIVRDNKNGVSSHLIGVISGRTDGKLPEELVRLGMVPMSEWESITGESLRDTLKRLNFTPTVGPQTIEGLLDLLR